MLNKKKYDFAGWVTKNDIKCADGVTIMHDAFKDNDGKTVPLVWNHDYNTPENVLGHIELKNQKNGVYGYGHFNDTEYAKHAKELIKHGDVSSMSIGARKIKRDGTNVVHGVIYEVSLVLAGANPGAMIESVITHSESGDTESGIIYTDTLIHSADDIDDILDQNNEDTLEHGESKEEISMEKTIGDVMETMNEEQKDAVYALIGSVVESYEEEEETEGDEIVKQNVFNKTPDTQVNNNDTLKHSIMEAVIEARDNGVSFKKVLLAKTKDDEVLTHGIRSIEMLFPEAAHSTNGNEPIIYKDPNTAYVEILAATHKSPFSNIRTTVADLTQDEARAKGYVKGTLKKEEYFALIKRVTGPCTVYKKQKLDRDDIIEITDFNVVAFMSKEMQMMLKEELARAILVGDGRDVADADKIKEGNIRPVISDNEFFTIHKTFTNAADFAEKYIKAKAEYRGSGRPTMYIDPDLLADIKLLKGTDNRFLFGAIPSTEALAAMLGLAGIVETSFMVGKGALIVNLTDYSVGTNKGGEITNFDDFDIDFNQYKYLIETRLSGALTMPKSAIHMATTIGAAATDIAGGLTFGEREPVIP